MLPESAKKLLAPYFPGFDLDLIRVREGIPWYVPMKAAAYTDRDKIYFAPGAYDPYSIEGIALIGHEIMHILQYREYGTWRFRYCYGKAWAVAFGRTLSFKAAYGMNPFECAAREIEERICRELWQDREKQDR
ncbi:MAG TPA: DUF4157 domain-containing protein [Blastocatellia bacterium]|nr:DUF4157 domain-containing protein [Blastocatellia bacterium]